MSSNTKSGTLSSNAVGVLHSKLVSNRRVEVLADWFVKLLPSDVSVLDVGCGDRLLSALVQQKRPDISVPGVDVLSRAHTLIPVEIFDGSRIPYPAHHLT